MVTVKKETIRAKKFEHEIIAVINNIKKMELPKEEKRDLLNQLRALHNNCLEWGAPEEEFKIIDELKGEYA